MSCSTTLLGIALDCNNTGGIREVYISPCDDVTSVTLTADKISAIAMADAKKFHKYSFRRGTSAMTKTATRDDAAGTSFVTSEVSMKFARMDSAKRVEMQNLLDGNTYVIVLDNNGEYWFLGYNSYCGATAAGGESGTAMGDANQYTITLTAETNEFPYTVDKTAITSIIA